MIWNAVKTHVGYVVVIAVGLYMGRLWLTEHDARVQADNAVKVAQTTIAGLQKQQSATVAQAAAQVSVLKREAATVTTPAAAVADIPKVSTVDLHPEALPVGSLPDAPDKVAVDAVPLDHELNAARQDSVDLTACTSELSDQRAIDGAKDTEIVALKKKPSFWHNLKSTAEAVGIGVAVGYVYAHSGH